MSSCYESYGLKSLLILTVIEGLACYVKLSDFVRVGETDMDINEAHSLECSTFMFV